jgi:hypothetical protein
MAHLISVLIARSDGWISYRSIYRYIMKAITYWYRENWGFTRRELATIQSGSIAFLQHIRQQPKAMDCGVSEPKLLAGVSLLYMLNFDMFILISQWFLLSATSWPTLNVQLS